MTPYIFYGVEHKAQVVQLIELLTIKKQQVDQLLEDDAVVTH